MSVTDGRQRTSSTEGGDLSVRKLAFIVTHLVTTMPDSAKPSATISDSDNTLTCTKQT
jgi:hypothetical protein